ncbi:MAG: hypothetical protein QW318_06315 [Candidatus Caldarchaeum sp.]
MELLIRFRSIPKWAYHGGLADFVRRKMREEVEKYQQEVLNASTSRTTTTTVATVTKEPELRRAARAKKPAGAGASNSKKA